jgi:LCP family protein required for cell wall assembly
MKYVGIRRARDYSPVLLALFILLLAGLTCAAVWYTITASRSSLVEADGSTAVINTLFILEKNDAPLCSYLVLFYPPSKRAAVFDVPGDIGSILKSINRVDRIDAVYNSNDPSLFIRQIEKLLSVTINYYVIITADNLAKLVDILSGVPVAVSEDIKIYSGADSVLFSAGRSTLDGDKTSEYLARRPDEDKDDDARARRRQFFIGFLQKLIEKHAYLERPSVAVMFSRLLRTNMSNRVRERFFSELAHLDTERITIQTITGVYREVSGRRLLFPSYNAELIRDIVRQTLSTLTRAGAYSSNGRVITIEVLNGTTSAGLAARTAELLDVFGYNVLKVGNAGRSDYAKTEIIDRLNQPEEAANIADLIKCENIIADAKSNRSGTAQTDKADFILIIGKDFNGRFTGK